MGRCAWGMEGKDGRRIPVSFSSFPALRMPEIHEMLSCSGKDKSLLWLCALFLLLLRMRVLENYHSWEVVQNWSKAKKIFPPTFLPVIAAQEKKFKLVEEILLLCGSTNVYGLILEMESLPAARVLIVCKYKHRSYCVWLRHQIFLCYHTNEIKSGLSRLCFLSSRIVIFFIGLDSLGSSLLETSSHKHLCACCKFILVCFVSFTALPLSCLHF